MNKNISQRIICPKCGTRNLRKSHPPRLGNEYFCDKDHEYFGIFELVEEWNYDVADFYGLDVNTQLSLEETYYVRQFNYKRKTPTLIEFIGGARGEFPSSMEEPKWDSLESREKSYEVVNRMLSEIEEWEEGSFRNDLPYPILSVGMG